MSEAMAVVVIARAAGGPARVAGQYITRVQRQ